MSQHIALISLVVADYDEAIAFYTEKLRFRLEEDTPLSPGKRWVVVAPPGAGACRLLLARASNPDQEARVGNQTGGRVGFFLHTDDFAGDFRHLQEQGVTIVEGPRYEPYGTVAVFTDLYGNKWDLVEPNK
ncbi:MAG: VOC family protein [Lewinella sp.]|nr:VOC family protein [Lewinella sp.]